MKQQLKNFINLLTYLIKDGNRLDAEQFLHSTFTQLPLEQGVTMATAMRVPSATVELIQILGTILRDRVGLSISKTECWTFPKILKKDDSSFEPSNPVATFERAQNEYLIYLGAGHCMVQKPGSGQDRLS